LQKKGTKTLLRMARLRPVDAALIGLYRGASILLHRERATFHARVGAQPAFRRLQV